MIGSQILHYKIRDKLGEGGMGAVYLARDTKLDRDVALKFLPESLRADPEARERFIREARAASSLNHANIVAIHAIEQDNDRDFIVMEYVAGRSLREVIRAGELTVGGAADVARQIAEGLAAAHEVGIVHRDIKSDNIIVTPRAEAKILDFGLALTLEGDKTRMTGEASTLGTVGYMSPEQASGGKLDHRSDLFSLGVILYEMLTGRLPFEGDHSAAVTYAIINNDPEPVSRYKTGVPRELEAITEKLLRKDPKTRYQTARGLVGDLDFMQTGSHAVAPAKNRPSRGARAMVGVLLVLAIAAVFFVGLRRRGDTAGAGGEGERLMIAVLPFENLGGAEAQYFADGMTEEITTHLAKLSGLGVISRTSAMQYRTSEKTIRVIGAELGVDYVLEGTIRWDKSGGRDRVRINPQLIRVSDDTHLWADTYDRDMREVFALQTEIAAKVVSALNVTLLAPEQTALRTAPTDNLDAYQYYLRGIEYYRSDPTFETSALAEQMFEKAVAADPSFAHAHSYLARMYANDYFNNRSTTEPRLEQARAAAEAAMRYAGDGPEGHLAMGYFHYYGSRDYERALEEFEIAREGQPNNSELIEAMGYVQRRQGRWEECVSSLSRALELDPTAENIASELVATLWVMRRFDEARALIDRRLDLSPDSWAFLLMRGMIDISTDGNPDAVAPSLEHALELAADARQAGWMAEMVDTWRDDYESALSRRPTIDKYWDADSAAFYVDRARLHFFAGHDERARLYADSALVILERLIAARPDDLDRILEACYAQAVLGNKEAAMLYGRQAARLMPLSRDAFTGLDVLYALADIHARFGENDLAIDQIEALLNVPSWATPVNLSLEPMWDSLHDEPRFKALERRPIVPWGARP